MFLHEIVQNLEYTTIHRIIDKENQLNIKKGLERIWVVISALWMMFVIFSLDNSENVGLSDWVSWLLTILFMTTAGLMVLWGILYLGFWFVSGFGGKDKDKDKTDG